MAFLLIGSSNKNLTGQVTEQAKSYANLSNQPIVEAYKLYYNSGYLKFRQVFLEVLKLDENISRVQIFDANGYLLADSDFLPLGKPAQEKRGVDNTITQVIKDARPGYFYTSTGQMSEIIYPYEDSWGNRGYAVKYFVSYGKVTETANEVMVIILIFALSSLALSVILINWLVGKYLLNPIEAVHRGALLISHGKLDYEIKVKTGEDEVEQLATAVNNMARALQTDIEALKNLDKLKDEFIAIASHNLRSPLTVIKNYLSFLKKGNKGPLNQHQLEYVNKISLSTDKLADLVEDLLSLAMLETENKGLLLAPTNLFNIAKEICRDFQEEADKKGVRLTIWPLEQPMPELKLDRGKVGKVFTNLLDNAIKFTSPGGEVTVYFETKDGDVITHIRDNGIGISKQEMGNLFQKFHRGTSVMVYNYPGIGIGLYLVKLIVAAHRGKIQVESQPNLGSTFSFSLPIATHQLD